jgi:hypothetical protein
MARLLVSDGTVSKQAGKYQIVVNGVVKPILRALAVKDGICRQYWPTVEPTTDQRIVWDTTSLAVNESVQDPIDAEATITFTRLTGIYTYDNYPWADTSGQYLSPGLDGTAGDDGLYFIKVTQTSGTALTGTLGSWIDLNSAATHVWSLDESVIGTLGAVANISVNNAAGVTVVKIVTFASTVVTGSDIGWSTTQADLVEIKESVDADCDIYFYPAGYSIGDADTSGSYNEEWNTASPDVGVNTILDRFGAGIVDRDGVLIEYRGPTAADYSVKTTLVSGTAPTGSALATALSLDVVRTWKLLATTGENLVCALDVEVDTIPTSNPVVKRITMNSERSDVNTDNVWTTAAWTLRDDVSDRVTGATLTMGNDGTTIGKIITDAVQEDEDWNTNAPTVADPENFEVMLTSTGIVGLITGSAVGVWINLASTQAWSVTTAAGNYLEWQWSVSVRRIGQLEVTKVVSVEIGVETPL